MFRWYREINPTERRTFWSCFGGWGLDALDVQMFSIALPVLILALGLGNTEAGAIGSVALVTSALGGWIAGALSDRYGRVRILQATIVWFSVCTFLCAFAQSGTQLWVLRALQGFGFGGEWAAGAVLMAEVIRPEHRGKVLATVQSAWAVGWGGAVVIFSGLAWCLPGEVAWRVMFGVGLLPALFVLYVRRAIPDLRPRAVTAPTPTPMPGPGGPLGIFSPAMWRLTLVGALLGVGAHGGYHALMTWLPMYLKTERQLSVLSTGGYLTVIIFAFWCGCLASAQLLDRIGRRKNILLFAVCCVVTVVVYLFLPLTNAQMLVLGFPLGFFAAGIPASLGAFFNELYPAGIRGTGVGFCYNFGRIASAGFPWLVGHMSESMPLGRAIGIDAALAYALVIVAAWLLPETKGRRLDVSVAGHGTATANPAGRLRRASA